MAAEEGGMALNGHVENGDGEVESEGEGEDIVGSEPEQDSSEEEDDEDEDELRKVREGFIVSDEEDAQSSARRNRHKKKRRRPAVEEEEGDNQVDILDEDDLDLVAENTGQQIRPDAARFKRLKRGDVQNAATNLDDIFSDDELAGGAENGAGSDDDSLPEVSAAVRAVPRASAYQDEFADFIEQDDYDHDEDRDGLDAAQAAITERQRRKDRGPVIQQSAPEQIGLDPDAYEEAIEIFGDGEDYADALDDQQYSDEEAGGEEKERVGLQDIFEPGELKERLLTSEDDQIRMTDEPERFQMLRGPYKGVHVDDVREEARWIANEILVKKVSKNLDALIEEELHKAVFKVVTLIVNDGLEVPFIFTHRKDYLKHTQLGPNGEAVNLFILLDQDDLWDIVYLDVKWRSMLDKKRSTRMLFDSLDVVDDDFIYFLNSYAKTAEEVADMSDYLHFRWISKIQDAQAGRRLLENGAGEIARKLPGQKYSRWAKIRASQIYQVVVALGLTPFEFGQNVNEMTRIHFTDDPREMPEQIADGLVGRDNYITTESILRDVVDMRAEEIASNPLVRRALRSRYMQSGIINIKPTEKGVKKIDELHPYYVFKYLLRQGIAYFINNPELYLQICAAQNEGLVEVEVTLSDYEQFKQEWQELLVSDGTNALADAWNDLRRQIFEIALNKLTPDAVSFVTENLRSEAESLIARLCRAKLLSKIDRAPYIPPLAEFDKGTSPKVLAISSGEGDPSRNLVVAVMLDRAGLLRKYEEYPNMQEEYHVQQFVQLVEDYKPEVIAIAGLSVATYRLHDDVIKALNMKQLDIKVQYVNDEIARLFQNHNKAVSEFPSVSTAVRYCISLGRSLQNPLLEYAALGSELTSIIFHRLQHLIPESKLMLELESAFVDVVNLVGIEINHCVKDTRSQILLPYICGLGPRKASSLVNRINAIGGYVSNRESLIQQTVTTRNGFINCASFFRIAYSSLSNPNEHIELLDSTRIHPEDYDLAKKMAGDALELDEEDLVEYEEDKHHGGVIQALLDDDPGKLDELLLDEYAERLKELFHQLKRNTLQMIKDELKHPYEELREDYVSVTEDEVFTMLTGETAQSLKAGTVVPMVIRKIGERYAVGYLDCGVEGFIGERYITDDVGHHPAEVFHVNKTVRAVILSLDVHKFTAQVSTKVSDVEDALKSQRDDMQREIQRRPQDEWDFESEARDRQRLALLREAEQRSHRVIKHPFFRPYNKRQAEDYLSKQQRGDAVIRPSSLGTDHITITWKVSEGIYQHIDVLELNKDNDYSVGKILKVGKYTFSDLDEVLAYYIRSTAKMVDEMTVHEKFQDRTKEESVQWLTRYSEANPKRSNYVFCFDRDRPGFFDLCFKAGPNASVATWLVKAIPNAFELKKNTYPDMNLLTNGFKRLYMAEIKDNSR